MHKKILLVFMVTTWVQISFADESPNIVSNIFSGKENGIWFEGGWVLAGLENPDDNAMGGKIALSSKIVNSILLTIDYRIICGNPYTVMDNEIVTIEPDANKNMYSFFIGPILDLNILELSIQSGISYLHGKVRNNLLYMDNATMVYDLKDISMFTLPIKLKVDIVLINFIGFGVEYLFYTNFEEYNLQAVMNCKIGYKW